MKKLLRIMIATVSCCTVLLMHVGYGEREIVHAIEECVKQVKTQYINSESAIEIAEKFIKDTYDSGISKTWNEKTVICDVLKCYDTVGNVSAYVISLENNMSKADNGYVVVGACIAYCPVIEYSENNVFEGKEYLTDEEEMLIYEGGYDYYIKDIDAAEYRTCSEALTIVNVNDLHKTNRLYEEICEEWQNIDKEIDIAIDEILIGNYKRINGSSSVYDKYLMEGDADRIEGDVGTDYVFVNNRPNSFYLMTKFSCDPELDWVVDGCCSPTAAFNLLYYYYQKNPTYYGNLMTADAGYTIDQTTFIRMYEEMHTGYKTNGTLIEDIAPGIEAYLKRYTKFKNSKAEYINLAFTSFDTIVNELSHNRPVLLSTYKHVLYGDHTMLCVGIRTYSTGSYYYANADGHKSGLRYMNAYEGNGFYTSVITVQLYK